MLACSKPFIINRPVFFGSLLIIDAFLAVEMLFPDQADDRSWTARPNRDRRGRQHRPAIARVTAHPPFRATRHAPALTALPSTHAGHLRRFDAAFGGE